MDKQLDLMSVQDAAASLKVTPQYVRKLIKDKVLEAVRVGKQWVVRPEALQEFVAASGFRIEPDDHPRRGGDIPDIVALSFFSGAMGLDIGLRNGGIKALLACEFDRSCRMTIDANEPDMALIGDINKYTPEDILRYAGIPAGRKVDVIFGGPPCQAFSTAGARRALDDERGNVFLRFIEVVESIKPTYVVIENVRGLLSAPYPYKDISSPVKGGAMCVILDRLNEAGYAVSFELYNAANFGAPQIRERVVMIGKMGGPKVAYLSPTHDERQEHGLGKWRSLGEALDGMDGSEQHYIGFPESRLVFYRKLGEGQYWKDLSPEDQVKAMGDKLKLGGGKTGFFRRLSFSKPSPTLVTNPTMPATDLCHPVEDRPLSVEEYSKIQEFPEGWRICGSVLEQYRQIGNAVPIKLGEAIARTILADMRGERLPKYEGFRFSRYRNTSDVSWKACMGKILGKARKEQEKGRYQQISLLDGD